MANMGNGTLTKPKESRFGDAMLGVVGVGGDFIMQFLGCPSDSTHWSVKFGYSTGLGVMRW